MKKKLSAFLELCAHSLAYTITMHPERDPVIESLAFDSRQVREGSLFFALPGIHVHGNDFAEKAIAAGARAVVYEGQLPDAAGGGPPGQSRCVRVGQASRRGTQVLGGGTPVGRDDNGRVPHGHPRSGAMVD